MRHMRTIAGHGITTNKQYDKRKFILEAMPNPIKEPTFVTRIR